MIKVLIADDHKMFRDGLRRVLEDESSLEVVAEAENGPEALDKSREFQPDIVLLDVVMPGRDSLEIVEELKRWNPGMRVLMLTSHSEDQYALRCLRAGADGYMTKINASDELITAIRKIHGGGKYISEALAELLAQSIGRDSSQMPHESLSDREFQVMRMIGDGKTVSEIADELNLSVKTVSTYRTRILEKTQLRNNAEIMRYVLDNDLID
ncbi:MAG: response regulator transcription factor [bacterium]|nr:response regulator transcription factor [bacterium]